jgi:hypothetical protein
LKKYKCFKINKNLILKFVVAFLIVIILFELFGAEKAVRRILKYGSIYYLIYWITLFILLSTSKKFLIKNKQIDYIKLVLHSLLWGYIVGVFSYLLIIIIGYGIYNEIGKFSKSLYYHKTEGLFPYLATVCVFPAKTLTWLKGLTLGVNFSLFSNKNVNNYKIILVWNLLIALLIYYFS